MNIFEVTDERSENFAQRIREYLRNNDIDVDIKEVKSRLREFSVGEMLALATSIDNDNFDQLIQQFDPSLLEYALPGRHGLKSTAYDRPKPNRNKSGDSEYEPHKKKDKGYATSTLGKTNYRSSTAAGNDDDNFATAMLSGTHSRNKGATGRTSRTPRPANRMQENDEAEGPFYSGSGRQYYYMPFEGVYYDPETGEYFDDAELFENSRKRHRNLESLVEAREQFLENPNELTQARLARRAAELIAKSVEMER